MGWSHRAAFAGIILAVAANFAAEARGESLGEAWAVALRANQRLQSQQAQSVAAGFELSAAKAARLPTVRSRNFNVLLIESPAVKSPFASTFGNGGGPGSPNPNPGSGGPPGAPGASNNYHILGPNQNDLPISFTMATIPLYTGGRLLRDIDAAGEQTIQARTEEFRVALDLKLQVAEAYIAVLRARKVLDVALSNVERLSSFARDVANRRAQGLAIRSDELAAEVSLANAQLMEIEARTDLEKANATYNRLLYRPLGAVVDLEELAPIPAETDWMALAQQALRANSEFDQVSEPEVSAMIGQALRERPELAGLSAQARGLSAQAESARSNVRPQLNLGGGLIYIGAQNSATPVNGFATVSLDWQITDGGVSRRKAAALHQLERAAIKERADLAADIALEVRTRWLDLRQAHLRVPVARYAVLQAEENVKVIVDRYRQDLSTYTEVLDAENRRVQALTNMYNALYDESLAFFRLHRSIGDL